MTTSHDPAARKDKILAELKTIINSLTGIDPAGIDVHADFLELGIESLLIIQATQVIQDKFAIKLSVIQLLEELTTVDAVATYLDQQLPLDDVLVIQDAPITTPRAEMSADVSNVSSPQRPMPLEDSPSAALPQETQIAERPPAGVEPRFIATQTSYPPSQPQSFARADAPGHSQDNGVRSVNGGATPAVSASALEQIMAQQLQVMAQQLAMLSGGETNHGPRISSSSGQFAVLEQMAPTEAQHLNQPMISAGQPLVATAAPTASGPSSNENPEEERLKIQPETFIPYQPIQKGATGGLTPHQQQHLDELIRSYTSRTRESKRLTQLYRPYLADSRVSAGFRLLWKEMIYQIFAQRSQGSKIWDVDGNEYVDITMGFGLHLFGHSPSFITDAIQEQLKLGMELGPQSPLTGKVAKLISDLTGLDRVNFCNSGTEAVMGALRVARTVTRRNKIALFAGAYHGWSDATLARKVSSDGTQSAVPMAPGVPPLAVEDTLVLDWNDPKSLDILRVHANELACVLVEPVQSRRPDIQPKAFLHELRRITEQSGSLLIIDEMVTGFRVHPGGAQAWFDVQADLAIYGKVVGGGLPLGIVAGKAAYMDAFDGGPWNYGDASYPRAEKTLFAGAYFKHPLTMAVAHAILTRLKNEGLELLAELNERTTQLTQALDNIFAQQRVPMRVANYGSLFRLLTAREFKYVDIFYYHLQENGVFVWEGRNCFLSTAHTDEDVEHIIEAVRKSIEQTRAGGFLPDGPPDSLGSDKPSARAVANQARASALNGGSAHDTATLQQQTKEPAVVVSRAAQPTRSAPMPVNQNIQFSLYYFGNYPTEFYQNKYELVFKGAKFADEHNFTAVWLPERHFNSYGGFSPNPATIAAALAVETKRIQLRAGSIALPLHHPIRVAEEWSIVDNLSQGRVAMSFASGWHANDFVFAPESYENRRQVMDEGIEVVRKLWRGESIQVRDGKGDTISVSLSPMPMQAELPFWLTGASIGTAIKAGKIGAGYLTNLQDQTIDELAEKIAAYRAALSEHGHAPEAARVTVLLHTFMTDDVAKSIQKGRQPFQNYLRASMGLQVKQTRKHGPRVDFDRISDADLDYLTLASFERYLRVGTLIGTPDSCSDIIDKLIKSGVTEVGCLVDFGVPVDEALESLHYVNQLRERYQTSPGAAATLALAAAAVSGTRAQQHYQPEVPVIDDDQQAPLAVVPKIPLTDTQKQFWALIQHGDHISSAYNESTTLHLHGQFDASAMREALQSVLDRHDAFRSIFSPTGDYQEIQRTMQLDIPLLSFEHLPESERAAQCEAWTRAEMQKPFDFARGPLLRAQIAKLDELHHVLLITTHHIIADGQSWGVLLKELSTLYSGKRQRLTVELPPPVSLSEQVQPQLSGSTNGETAQAESYWLNQFADGIPRADLPADHPRPRVPTYERAASFKIVDAALGRQLKAFSRQHGCTLFVTMLASYEMLLHQLTGQPDLVVGINAAAPASVGRKAAIGYRVTPLAVRSKISGDPTIKEFLTTAKKLVLGAYENQNFSLTRLLKLAIVRRDRGPSSFVAAGINLDRGIPNLDGFHDLEVVTSTHSTSAPSLDLYLDITESRDELRLKCNYNTDLFEAGTIERWLDHFEQLLQAMVAQPEQPISHLPQFPGPRPRATEPATVEAEWAERVAPRSNLTKYQLLLWAGQKLNPDAAIFINAGLVYLDRAFNPSHLQEAFQALIDHSDALRTVIDEVDGVPQRRVVETFPYQLEFLDFSKVAEPQAELDRWAQARCRRSFDMSTRLFDAAVIRLGPEQFAWYLNTHHVIADVVSVTVAVGLALNYYEAVLEKRLTTQPNPPQFEDFIAYEQGLLKSPKYRNAEVYWREKLAEPVEPLAFYGQGRVKGTINVQRIVRRLGRERTKKIKELAARKDLFMISQDATLFGIFGALWVHFLCSISGNRRIALGVPFHNRGKKDFRETIGLFMRILPLRVTVAESETFLTLIKKINREFFAALRYHEFPVGNPLQNPSYEVEFNFMNQVMFSPDGKPVRWEWVHSGHSNESLALQIHDLVQSGNLSLNFDFNCDVFSEEKRARAIEHFLQVVDEFIADHTKPLRAVSVITPAERQRLLVELNQTAVSFPLQQTFTELFEAQVARSPERRAVVCGAEALTYTELNARANRVAQHLREVGVGPNVVVPLLASRGVDFLTGLLAIFKAGGAYLPLDPLYPAHRLTRLLSQSQCSQVLTTKEFKSTLAHWLDDATSDARPQVLELEELLRRAGPETNLSGPAGPGDLSYVIYTSGSTGVPKGVMIEQQGMVNHLYAKITDLGLTESDIVAQTASQAFDISVWQFLAALLVGGQVLIVSDEASRDAAQLLTLVDDQAITVLETVPSLLRAMLAAIDIPGAMRPALSTLRWLLVTGEALPPDLCESWLRSYANVPLLNAYGPTECSDDVTHYVVKRKPAHATPIGRPIANMRTYVLDQTLAPVPLGVPGELYVGGIGVGRGYLNDPAHTAEVFIPDPFSAQPQARLYKTGDLVRYQSDGNLEFLGRLDQQVKIRGYRIELGDIETMLREHPSVQQVVVTAREDVPGEKRLVAYLVALPGHDASVNELRNFLQKKLPEYMLPAAFVMLDALPLTQNGKVDIKKLPAPEPERPDLQVVFVAPRTPAEEALAAIFKQVLHLERVGVHDNFFELGGDSILSIQIVSRANQAGLRLTPMLLFQHQTIAELAALANLAPAVKAEQGLVTGHVPLTPIQHWFFQQELTNPNHYNQAVLLQVQPPFDAYLLERAVGQLLQHHDALRLRFKRQNSYWEQQCIEVEESVPFSRHDLSMLPEAEQKAALASEAARLQASLDLSEGPIMRVACFDLGAERPGRLLLIIHHLAVDSVSWRVLIEDLQMAYEQLSRAETVQLPPKSTSYKEWSERLTAYARSDELTEEQEHWLVAPRVEIKALPLDYDAGENLMNSASGVSESLLADETEQLLTRTLAALDAQINDVLLAALAQVISRWTGGRALLVDLESHGREELFPEVDLTRTVGWFTTMSPVLLDLGGAATAAEELEAVKEQVRHAPRHGVSYGVLRYLHEDAALRERLRNSTEAEISFNYLGQIDKSMPKTRLFSLAAEPTGPPTSRDGRRPSVLAVNGLVVRGQLRFDWSFSQNLHRRETIAALARDFVDAIRSFIHEAASGGTENLAESRLADFKWDQSQVNDVAAALNNLES